MRSLDIADLHTIGRRLQGINIDQVLADAISSVLGVLPGLCHI